MYQNSILNRFLVKTLFLTCHVLPFIAMIADSVFSVHGYSNLFTGSALNALDLYINYTAEVVPLRTYIVQSTSV